MSRVKTGSMNRGTSPVHENERFRNWWYADLYDDLIVFYSPFRDGEKGAAPVKAWRRYSQVWRSEA